MTNDLTRLDVFKAAACQVQKPICTGYIKKEKTVLSEKRKKRREETKSITMSAKKFHKSFSL